MSTKFKTVITTAGAAKLAAATVPGGKKINLNVMAVGDGGGKLPVPDAGQTQLVNEVWRHTLNKISQDNRYSNYIVAELVIPPEVGGFWMRELGLYDDEGTLIAVANMAESYKPELAEGSGRAQTCRMVIIVSSVESVALSIDSTMVMATQDYVDDRLAEHEKSRRHPDATLKEKGFTQLSNATDSESETLAATPKAVKAAYDLADGKYTAQDATTTRKGLVQLSNATDSVSETLAATPKAVKTAMDNANERLAKDRNGADIPNVALFLQNVGLGETINLAKNAVPATRRVNNKPLSGDITLSAVDVNAFALGMTGDTLENDKSVGWNWKSGVYNVSTGGASSLILHFNMNIGSCPAVQFCVNYKNGGISYRSARDDFGFELDWTEFYTTTRKPSAGDVGALPVSGGVINGNLGIGTPNILGGSSIVLGDNDTGLKQNGDGLLDIYANGVQVFRFQNDTLESKKSINITGRLTPTDYGNFDSRYVQDIRLGSLQYAQVWNGPGFNDTSGYVITGITNGNSDELVDGAQRRPIQKLIGNQWYNVVSI
ncbi:phage tail protein [Salmonella enterica subsp. houtenae]|uniref:Phage tail protein n=2 Tax=Salmonella houtenae TaxID=59205 RepID=A0A753AZH2_SALHO|nr:phage tail protein [Salmonella enterica]EBL5973689.1 phage tail protein [Salmonella enterica subsp. enterica serovar Montevideo]ECE6872677.1 phage tail protein [Salmonella enterica subsp. houtenae]ECV5739592.1 phage tail protein [Salmonella enterica subsp. enterica serovar Tennessee]EDQ3206507.1 phage tail protein [Salmonella enterica subsp. enterica serovar Suelldorf]EIY9582481.1 phage tail protein [Salmonella enterica subsp. enterica]HAE7579740.1 phage tail protein [Salmonella enterica s